MPLRILAFILRALAVLLVKLAVYLEKLANPIVQIPPIAPIRPHTPPPLPYDVENWYDDPENAWFQEYLEGDHSGHSS